MRKYIINNLKKQKNKKGNITTFLIEESHNPITSISDVSEMQRLFPKIKADERLPFPRFKPAKEMSIGNLIVVPLT